MPTARNCRLVVTLLALAAAQPSLAGKVYLLNGDVITADIIKIWDEEVTIEPTYADEFLVDLDAVSHFESERVFDVEFPDGRSVKARLLGGDEGTQVLEIDGRVTEVPIMSLAELDEPEDEFNWDSNIDVNSVVNTGNTDNSSVTLQFRTNLKLGDQRHIVDLSTSREEQDSETVKDQDRGSYAYNWSFRDSWFLAVNAAGERDPVRNLDYRYTIGGGVGYDIWSDAARFWQLQAFGGYLEERFDAYFDEGTMMDVPAEANDSAIAGWIVRFNFRLIQDLNIFHDHTAFTTLSGRQNSVFQSSTGVRYEITDLLYANAQFDFDWESDPTAGAKNTDTTTILGLGLEF